MKTKEGLKLKVVGYNSFDSHDEVLGYFWSDLESAETEYRELLGPGIIEEMVRKPTKTFTEVLGNMVDKPKMYVLCEVQNPDMFVNEEFTLDCMDTVAFQNQKEELAQEENSALDDVTAAIERLEKRMGQVNQVFESFLAVLQDTDNG